MIGRRAGVAIYPLLFAVYPILALFGQNASQVRAGELSTVLAWALAAAAGAWLVAVLLLRDVAKGALVAAVAILMFYSLGFVQEWANYFAAEATKIWIYYPELRLGPLWILVPEVLLLAAVAIFVSRRAKGLRGATRFLNGAAVTAVFISLAQIFSIKAPAATRPARTGTPLARLSTSTRQLPDIYYIILDGYARPDVMKSLFGLDTTGFIEHLERRGFYVARNSTANYVQTPLCLSCSLNSTYLDELVKGLDRDQTALKDLIGRNDVLATLRPLGYRFVTFATGFEPTEQSEADRYLSPRARTTEFERMVIDMTPARLIWPDPHQMNPFYLARERINYLLDHLPDVARDSRPTFAFAHLLCPHPPMVFGENGEDVSRENEKYMLFHPKINGRFPQPDEFRRAYRDQAAYITRRIQETIDRVLAESPEPPIIIVQSDHGSELELDMHNVENTNLHERMSILNAYYFPDGRYEGLYDSISPVNSFRVVLNTFFGASLPPLPDRSFYSTWPEPYQFIDVTDRVRPRGVEANGVAASPR